ncbi:MAG: hypothetical protein ACEQR8_10600 [Cypionkella sp.]
MVEERITEVETPTGNTHTTHTVIHDEERRGGGAGWLIALLLIVALVAGYFIVTSMSGAEVAKDNAIADAAGDVSEAAQKVGDAVDGN